MGVALGDVDADLSGLRRFERAAGARARLVGIYQAFGLDQFDAELLSRLRAHGAVPMVTWEPWDWRKGLSQPDFALARIAGGAFDDYARAWAAAAHAWGRVLYLRFAPEMNGDWRPWSERVNGNRPGDFVAAWRHLHAVFAAAGARNVRWVWSPNAIYEGAIPLARLYPGRQTVDLVGIDGFNWGTTQSWSSWQSFESVFGPTLRSVRRLTHKPVLLTEVASADRGGDKARWLRGFFRGLARHREIRGFVWFNEDKEADWRIDSSNAARRTFAWGVSARKFRVPPGFRP